MSLGKWLDPILGPIRVPSVWRRPGVLVRDNGERVISGIFGRPGQQWWTVSCHWRLVRCRAHAKLLAHRGLFPYHDFSQVCRNGSHAHNVGCVFMHVMHSVLNVMPMLCTESSNKNGEGPAAPLLLCHSVGVIAGKNVVGRDDPVHKLLGAFLWIHFGVQCCGLTNYQL